MPLTAVYPFIMRQWKYALRALVRRPAFTLGVLALLAVGIAVNTALFSLVDTVVWKPLPYPDPDRLVALYEASPAKDQKVSLIAPVWKIGIVSTGPSP